MSELHKNMYGVCDNKCFVKINDLLKVTIPANGWSASAPYTQTVVVAGMDEYFNPTYALNISEGLSSEQEKNILKAYGFISELTTMDGQIKLSCNRGKPAVDIPLVIKVV